MKKYEELTGEYNNHVNNTFEQTVTMTCTRVQVTPGCHFGI